MRDQLDDIAEMLGVELTPKAEVDGVRLNASMAFSGYGPTIVPATAVSAAAASPDWTTRALAEGPRREVGLAVTRRGQLSAPARVVHDLIREVVHASAGDVPGVRPVD
jgi:DNA-binding transcriptional LysR family regulator